MSENRTEQTLARAVGVPVRLRSSCGNKGQFHTCPLSVLHAQKREFVLERKKSTNPYNFFLQGKSSKTQDEYERSTQHIMCLALRQFLYLCDFNSL